MVLWCRKTVFRHRKQRDHVLSSGMLTVVLSSWSLLGKSSQESASKSPVSCGSPPTLLLSCEHHVRSVRRRPRRLQPSEPTRSFGAHRPSIWGPEADRPSIQTFCPPGDMAVAWHLDTLLGVLPHRGMNRIDYTRHGQPISW